MQCEFRVQFTPADSEKSQESDYWPDESQASLISRCSQARV